MGIDMENIDIEYMVCDICNGKLHPLDAHMAKIDVQHILIAGMNI